MFFGERDEQQEDHDDQPEEDEDEEDTAHHSGPSSLLSGGRRLGDEPSAPESIRSAPAQPSRQKKSSAPGKKFATLGDFNSDSQALDHDDDGDDNQPDLFAGGEKSGLAVQNPDDLKKKIVEKAMKREKPRQEDEPKPRKSYFTGTAHTLGGEDGPSRIIEAPPQPAQQNQRVDRVLHFWNDGFSIDDGDLYRTDDPRNAEILDGIRQGRVPLNIINILPGQEVDVEIKQHQENYVRPKKKYVPFSGQGNRLGSPTPGVPSMPGAFTTTPAAAASPNVELVKADVDESQPTITIQIRLGSGTRLPARFNATHTIGDVYSFVAAASPESQNRPWVLQTTFPPTELTDKSQILGEMADFKRGGVMVQKWK